jgi:RHS repeat-associated protein
VIKYQCSGWLKYKKGSSDLRGFTYTYDASGNITKIVTEGTNVPQAALTKEYTYDALGQLATEVNGSGTTFGYAYDTAGNIRNITKDGTVTKSFGYTNPSWPDLLTSVTSGSTTKDILYEGQSQTSDLPSSGNPVTYYNGRDYTFTWTKGRQLTEATVDGQNVKYAYDMSGVRTSKTVNGTTYNYTTLSGKVMRQQWDGKTLEFVYDDGNQPFAMIYKHGSETKLYYYLVNAQGDVSAILDSGGKIAASYDYDAWGNCTVYNSSDAAIGDLNPLRYCGYYYDAETGFYYLQSRYYDFANCRFINADTFATTDANGFLSANMFAYCENNPVSNSDSEGEFPIQVVAAAVSGVVNLATSWASAKATGQTFTFLDGAVAFVAGAVGVFGSAGRFASAALSGAWTAYSISRNGGSTVGAISCGALSAGFSWFAFSNLAKFSSKRVDHILYKAATDASLGWGSNLIIAGATTAATAPRAPQKSKHKKNNVSEYRYAKEDHIRWKYYAEHFANIG